jgi:acetoin utilization deacetylase AcuC-like enzyme
MRWFHSETHLLHDPDREVWAGTPTSGSEVPRRAEGIAEALAGDPVFVRGEVREHGVEPVERVHDPAMVTWLEGAWAECRPLSETREIIPDTIRHAGIVAGLPRHAEPTESPLGRLGYWCFDTMTPLVEGTYRAARGSVDVALSALDAVVGGEESAYALCRPPGHHAGTTMIGGFCFFNNTAIVAGEWSRRLSAPVAILDVDIHHGNGTQQIFYERADVVYASLHADPERAFPYFTGHADETGAGAGAGANRNFPLAAGCDDQTFLETLGEALEYLGSFAPGGLVVSLGVDTCASDPLSDLAVSSAGLPGMGRLVRDVGLPTVVVQEGGYGTVSLGFNVRVWLRGLAGAEPLPREAFPDEGLGKEGPERHV